MNLSMDDVAIPNPRVLFRELGGEAVLLDLDTETYFGLNETAARLWALLSGACPIREALAVVGDEYDVPPEILRSDLEELLTELERLGLIRVGRA